MRPTRSLVFRHLVQEWVGGYDLYIPLDAARELWAVAKYLTRTN